MRAAWGIKVNLPATKKHDEILRIKFLSCKSKKENDDPSAGGITC